MNMSVVRVVSLIRMRKGCIVRMPWRPGSLLQHADGRMLASPALRRIVAETAGLASPRPLAVIQSGDATVAALEYAIAIALYGHSGACLLTHDNMHEATIVSALTPAVETHGGVLVILATSGEAQRRQADLARSLTTTSTPATSNPSGGGGRLSSTMLSFGRSINRPSPST